MYFIGGTIHAGKVDEAPGRMFYVVTRFEHLFYVPIIPQASFVVFDKLVGGAFHGIQIPLSLKSILMGWLRAFLVIASIIAGLVTLLGLGEMQRIPGLWIAPLTIAAATVLFLVMTYRLKLFSQASYRRAMALGEKIGLDRVSLLELEVAYGRMTAAQAEAELAPHIAKAAAQPAKARVVNVPRGFLQR